MSITAAPTIGSLCSGYGGLEIALRQIFKAEPAWLSELSTVQDTAKSRPRHNACLDVLAHHYPGVPNLGDLDLIDWQRVERTTILCAGFPCQPASAAGRQQGDKDPRWKWPGVLVGILAHCPPLVVLENVQNLVSINGGALWRGILDDLRAAGYAVAWGVFGACLESVLGCHHRHRVFLLGRYVGAGRTAPEAMRWHGKACGVPRGRNPVLAALRGDEEPGRVEVLFPTPSARDGGPRGSAGNVARRAEMGRNGNGGVHKQLDLPGVVTLLPSPTASTYGSNQGGGMGRVGPVRHSLESLARLDEPEGFRSAEMATPVQPERFGQYAWAVDRWTGVHGYPPEPTEVGPKGGVRLAPAFPEWMMGLPAGYVIDLAPRNDALRIIGNGVMPLQAVTALRALIAMFEADVSAYHERAQVAAPDQVKVSA